MSDKPATTPQSGPTITLPPVSAAMTVLAEAEVVAGSTRAQADHYARQREAEADLLVQKARRVLEAAEAKAAAIVSAARTEAQRGPVHTIDLDAPSPDEVAEPDHLEPSELDRLIDGAIGRAVSDALSEG